MTRDRDAGRDNADRAALTGLLADIRDRVLDAARLHPGHHVLDLGAGTGLLTHTAARAVAPTGSIIALDLSATALAQIRTDQAKQIRPVVGDASHLPIATATVDRVVTRSVLIYLPDLPTVLGEIARVLRPAGILSAFEPINARRHHNAQLDDLTTAELEAIDGLRRHSSPTAGPVMAFDVAPLTTAAIHAGFTAPTVHETTVIDRLTSHTQVDAYLHRRPHPGADSPADLITHHLGAHTAARYITAWHHALDQATDPDGITFTTPVLYLTSSLERRHTA
nr:methyltransferase domain-containing protein [Micromonospora sp. DSM 115978]